MDDWDVENRGILDWGGIPGGGRDNGGGGRHISTVVPPAPTNVRVKVTGIDAFTVSWRDYSGAEWAGGSPFTWFVRYCSQSVAQAPVQAPATFPGPPSSWPAETSSWAAEVLFKSRHIGSVPALGTGQTITLSHNEVLADGYILVFGAAGSAVGPPSYPLFVRFSANNNVAPDVLSIGVIGLTVAKERVPRDALRLEMQYFLQLPPIVQEFAGVHPHIIDYDGVATPREIGSMTNWDGSTGITTATYRLPVETGLATGTALFTAASTSVTWVSGDAFSAAYLGRRIVVDVSATVASVYEIDTYAAPNIALFSMFLEGTGTYSWKILRESHIHLVPIGKSGRRVNDVTTAPLLVI